MAYRGYSKDTNLYKAQSRGLSIKWCCQAGVVVRDKILSILGFLIVFLLLAPSALAVSLSGVAITPATLETTTDFRCAFTPTGDGSLTANITWYLYNTSSWAIYPLGNESKSVTTGVPTQSNDINSSATAKNQLWLCSVTLYNASNTTTINSSNVTIDNALPYVTTPVVDQVAYEDTAFNLQANATDPDGDGIIWSSSDLNASLYGGTPLFSITSGGLISFTHTDETLVGNHSMLLTPLDTSESPPEGQSIVIVFTLVAVNDAPVITTVQTNYSCEEDAHCTATITATDEESDPLTFTANDSMINMSTGGTWSFYPTFSDIGNHTINITVSDNSSANDSFVITLEINETNRAPNITAVDNTSVLQNHTGNFTFYINATDNNSADTLTFTINTQTCSANPWSLTTISNESTNGSALVNINLSNNNNYVVCRDVTFSVSDGKTTVYQNVTFNITNVNDPPNISEISYLGSNIQYNISNLSTSTGADFSYQVNASDVDSLTYEGESFNYSLVGHNSTLWSITNDTGIITSTSTVNASFLGNHSFNVSVTDDGGLITNITINISVVNNEFPVIITTNITDCTENVTCTRTFVGQDVEGDQLTLHTASLVYTDPTGTNTTYNFTQTTSYLNLSLDNYNGNETNYTFEFTPEDVRVGNYTLNFSYRDTLGLVSSQVVTFDIDNVNDVPYLGESLSSNQGDSITFSTIVIGVTFSKTLYGIDGDLTYNQDNLTFAYNYISGSVAATTFTKTANNTAVLNITPTTGEDGNVTINLTVTDSTGANTSRQVNFTVNNASLAPQFEYITPSMTNGSLNTSLITANASGTTYINITENTTVNFDFNASDTESFNVTWYVDGTQVANFSYGTHNYSYGYGFFSNSSANVTALLEDTLFSTSTYTWLVTIADSNRNPLFLNNRTNLSVINAASVSGTQTIQEFFRQSSSSDIVFIDPDDDLNSDNVLTGNESNTLTFSANSSSQCVADSYATFSFSDDDLTITSLATGTCEVNFIATDSGGLNVTSNVIRIDILETSDESSSSSSSSGGSSSRTRTVSVPLETEVDVPTELSILKPGIASIYDQGNVVIPVTVLNEWTEPLEFITLSTNISTDEDIEFEFSQSYIEYLAVGESVDINLTMFRYRADAPFEINISAYVESLDYTDTATVYINALEKGKEDIESLRTRIGFARDLLSDNPECQELNELLDEAERKVAEPNALDVINSVINGCKYLVNQAKEPRSETPKSFLGSLGVFDEQTVDYQVLTAAFMILVMGALIVAVIVQLRLKKI